MSVLAKLLFGVIQGILPDVITTVKGSLNKKNLAKLLDVNKDGEVDVKDLKIIAAGKGFGYLILAAAVFLLGLMVYEYFTVIKPNLQ